MNTWVEFVKARLDDQSATAPEVHHRDCASLPDGDQKTFSCDCGGPGLVLRQVEAGQRIITEFEESGRLLDAVPYPDGWSVGRHEGLEAALRLIALPYADHEAYPTE